MRNIPFACYVYHQISSHVPKIIELSGRPAVYQTVDAALRDEHRVIDLCRAQNRSIDLVTATSVETILRINQDGRISGRKAADTVAGTKSGS